MKIDSYLSPCTKLKSKWIKDLNIKPDTLNIIEEKLGKSLELIGTGGNFLNKMFNILNHQGNANQNNPEILPHTSQNG